MGVVSRTGAPDLYVLAQGQGPALVLIPGGGGDAGVYAEAAGLLAADHEVISYDRRGNSRSGAVAADDRLDVAVEAEDVLAVLDSRGLASAAIFGSSGGAIVALELIARHPERVSAAIVHEPPAVSVLEAASPERAELARIYRLGTEQGPMRGFAAFGAMTMNDPPWLLRSAVGQTLIAGVARVQVLAGRVLRGAIGKQPGTMTRMLQNVELLITRELPAFCLHWSPDVVALRESPVPWVLAVGADSAGRPYDRPARALAELTGTACVGFPGGHTVYQEQHHAFVERVTELLREVGGCREGA